MLLTHDTNVERRAFHTRAGARSWGYILAENVAWGMYPEEVADLVFLTVRTPSAHTSHVIHIVPRAPWDVRLFQMTLVDVLAPERVDVHCQCGAVLDGCRFVVCISCKL